MDGSNTQPPSADQYTSLLQMLFQDCRLQSFTDKWPFQEGSLTPLNMAKAGFYYCGTENDPDLVKCFVCLKPLDGWDRNDDPWEEHKSHSKKCMFVQLNKSEKSYTVENLIDLKAEQGKNMSKEFYNAWIEYLKERQEVIKKMNKAMKKRKGM